MKNASSSLSKDLSCAGVYICILVWKRMPQWKRNEWHWAYLQIPALSSLRVSLPNLVPLHIGMWGWKTTLWLVRCPLEPYGSSFHKHGSRCITEKTMKRIPIFVLLPFQCYAFIWNEYLISFFFFTCSGERALLNGK